MKTNHAKVHFNEQGTPVADAFDDVYFSNDSGVDETWHVFIAANQLPERWKAHQRPHFVIAETGFGTGLNCLVAMQAFAQFRQQNPQHPLCTYLLLKSFRWRGVTWPGHWHTLMPCGVPLRRFWNNIRLI